MLPLSMTVVVWRGGEEDSIPSREDLRPAMRNLAGCQLGNR